MSHVGFTDQHGVVLLIWTTFPLVEVIERFHFILFFNIIRRNTALADLVKDSAGVGPALRCLVKDFKESLDFRLTAEHLSNVSHWCRFHRAALEEQLKSFFFNF